MAPNACRTCLSENDLEELFLDGEPNDIAYKVMLISSLVITSDDNLSNYICYECVVKVDEAYEFRLQCEASEKYLKYQQLVEEEERSLMNKVSVSGNDQSDADARTEYCDVEYLKEEPYEIIGIHGTNDAYGGNYVQETNDIQETNDVHETNDIQPANDVQEINEFYETIEASETNNIVYETTYVGRDDSDDISSDAIEIKQIKRKRKKEIKRSFQCYVCGKIIAGATHLKNHMRVHTGEKPFACSFCNKTFSMIGNVKLHIARIHTHEKPAKCSYCPKTFVDMHGLIVHTRLHTGETPYKCNICPRAFKARSNLRYHLKLHSGERNYVCDLCNRSFTGKSSLNCHMRVHTGERPHKCPICGLKYTSVSKMKRHLLKHPGVERFVCKICNNDYPYEEDLTRHIHLRHPEEALKLNFRNGNV